MEKRFKNTKFELWEVIAITLFSSLVMSFCTGYLVYKGYGCNKYNGDDEYLANFYKSYEEIVDNYYSSVDKSALIDAGIKGMLNYLGDPYTTYLDKNGTDSLKESLSGTYEGIGVAITLNSEKEVVVSKVYENTPAEKAGVKEGDIILSINGESLEEKTTTDAVEIIKGLDDIVLICRRDNESVEIKLNKATLNVPSVNTKIEEINNKKIGYMYVSKFNQTVYDQFVDALEKLEKDNIDGLVIDLRDNTGGYLAAATKMAKLFLENGKVIYSLNEKNGSTVTKDDTDEARTYPVYALVNGNTASASEILAAALRDSYGAKLVGSTTYGKGKVQKTSTLSDGTMYKYTSAKWLTPNGVCIDEVGLKPDIEIDASADYTKDLVYNAAMDAISK